MATQNTRAEFRKKLLHLMIPISLQQLMMALVNASDAFMLGFVNQDALSAVSLAGQVQFVYSLFLFAITAGVSIFAFFRSALASRMPLRSVSRSRMEYRFWLMMYGQCSCSRMSAARRMVSPS